MRYSHHRHGDRQYSENADQGLPPAATWVVPEHHQCRKTLPSVRGFWRDEHTTRTQASITMW
jgi:hypothetical protein